MVFQTHYKLLHLGQFFLQNIRKNVSSEELMSERLRQRELGEEETTQEKPSGKDQQKCKNVQKHLHPASARGQSVKVPPK